MNGCTLEAFHAAVALGPVRAVCNVCGARHTYSKYGCYGSGSIRRPKQAGRCCHERSGRGIVAAYRANHVELDIIRRLLRNVERGLGVRCYERNRPGRGIQEAPWPIGKLDAVVSLGCAGGTRKERHIWTFARRSAWWLTRLQEYDVISPWGDDSVWLLTLAVEDADRLIADIYLGWLYDDALWDGARATILRADIEPGKERRLLARFDSAREQMEIIRARNVA